MDINPTIVSSPDTKVDQKPAAIEIVSSPDTKVDQKSAVIENEVETLRKQLERTQLAFVSTIMEKNFLERAMADLNFHHNAHDGIVFTDAQNRVVYANPYFLKMMNISDPAEILNKPLPGYMWSSNQDAEQLFKDVREYGFVRERELNLYNREKAPIFVACSSVASRDEDDAFVGTEIMLCNVTSKRKVQVELMQRQQDLERLVEFCQHTIQHLTEVVQRGASKNEMMALLKDVTQEFEQTKPN